MTDALASNAVKEKSALISCSLPLPSSQGEGRGLFGRTSRGCGRPLSWGCGEICACVVGEMLADRKRNSGDGHPGVSETQGKGGWDREDRGQLKTWIRLICAKEELLDCSTQNAGRKNLDLFEKP